MDPPYGIILNELKAGKVIPFLGAGASCVGRPRDACWDPAHPAFLPSGTELAKFLADEAGFPEADERERSDLAKVASFYAEIASDRKTLKSRLHGVLSATRTSASPLHAFLASVPASLVIVATNYDTLVEQAFRDARRPYDLVIYPADRSDSANVLHWPHGDAEPHPVEANRLDLDLGKTTVIYKMHGSIVREDAQWDNFVITEEDYVEFLSRMTMSTAVPASFFPYFFDRKFLFLGYSLRDWNLRVVLRNLDRRRRSGGSAAAEADNTRVGWAIQRKPSELEDRLWQARRVSVCTAELDEFGAKMLEMLQRDHL